MRCSSFSSQRPSKKLDYNQKEEDNSFFSSPSRLATATAAAATEQNSWKKGIPFTRSTIEKRRIHFFTRKKLFFLKRATFSSCLSVCLLIRASISRSPNYKNQIFHLIVLHFRRGIQEEKSVYYTRLTHMCLEYMYRLVRQ